MPPWQQGGFFFPEAIAMTIDPNAYTLIIATVALAALFFGRV